MVAPIATSESVTCTDCANVPPFGEIVGVATAVLLLLTVTSKDAAFVRPATVVVAVTVSGVFFLTLPTVSIPVGEIEKPDVDQLTSVGAIELPSDNVAVKAYWVVLFLFTTVGPFTPALESVTGGGRTGSEPVFPGLGVLIAPPLS